MGKTLPKNGKSPLPLIILRRKEQGLLLDFAPELRPARPNHNHYCKLRALQRYCSCKLRAWAVGTYAPIDLPQ